MPSTPRAAAHASRATCSHTCVKVNSSRTGKRGYCVLGGVKRRTDVCPGLRSFETTIANHGESPLFPFAVVVMLGVVACDSGSTGGAADPTSPTPAVGPGRRSQPKRSSPRVRTGSWRPTGGGSGACTGLEGSFNTSGDAITAVLAPVRRLLQARLRAPSICRNAKRARGADALTAAERTSH
jgi:hypothetical protein